jgi:exopolysaccharide biosynthesis polyprenyl glycosylphosphotransferase
MAGIYRSWRGDSLTRESGTVLMAWTSVFFVLAAIIFFISSNDMPAFYISKELPPTNVLISWYMFCYVGMAASRMSVRIFLRMIRSYGWNQRSVIIIGAGNLGKKIADYLIETPSVGISIRGFFDDKENKKAFNYSYRGLTIPLLGNIEDGITCAIEKKPDIVVIALPVQATRKTYNLIWKLGIKGVDLMVASDFFTFNQKKQQLRYLGDTPIIAFNLFPRWKRIFDIIFSLCVLIVISPLMLVVAMLVKLEDRGPVFFRHKRIGEYGKFFNCLKFRTMHVNADKHLLDLLEERSELKEEWDKNFKLKKDPRITKIGRILRKTSLDEFPQFINVLKGDMSVVGARPVVKDELLYYYNHSAITYCAMKPGITGPWQIGKRNDVENYDERVEQDRWYILNNSFWLDLQIIIKTAFKVFFGKGAY